VFHYPHRIRLRGPWECEPLGAPGGQPRAPLRMTMPCRWREGGLGDFAGRVRFTRRFGYPGRIDADERVWLTFAGVEGTAEVRLNGQPLGRHEGAAGPFEHEVTRLLQARNQLVVEVEELTGRGGLWGDVALEIRRTAHLRGVRAWAEPGDAPSALQVVGEVVGTAARPLDLYVLLDGANVAHAMVEAAPEGRPFRLSAETAGQGAGSVRVELVDAATVWYAVEQSVAPSPPASAPPADRG
jgi:hypothetical protein